MNNLSTYNLRLHFQSYNYFFNFGKRFLSTGPKYGPGISKDLGEKTSLCSKVILKSNSHKRIKKKQFTQQDYTFLSIHMWKNHTIEKKTFAIEELKNSCKLGGYIISSEKIKRMVSSKKYKDFFYLIKGKNSEKISLTDQGIIEAKSLANKLEIDDDKLLNINLKQVAHETNLGDDSDKSLKQVIKKIDSYGYRPFAKPKNNNRLLILDCSLKEAIDRLRDLRKLSEESLEEELNLNLHANLRPYQKKGVEWLSFLSGMGIGACLADDMGLGKTIQILSLLLIHKKRKENKNDMPSILIVPSSLLSNWEQEANRFAPSIKLLIIHPTQTKYQSLLLSEKGIRDQLKNIDLVLTTYSMVIRKSWILDVRWDLLIIDEAQLIKNINTKQTRLIKSLKSKSRIALTGTPIENRFLDLWSIFDFLIPGLLGSSLSFQRYAKRKPERMIKKMISPYILRRLKTESKIISDLPQKFIHKIYCKLTDKQIFYYQSVVNDMRSGLDKLRVDENPNAHRRIFIIEKITRLKQICNHPSLFSGSTDYPTNESGKFVCLQSICKKIHSNKEKAIIFTQFKSVIPYLLDLLHPIFGQKGLALHGGVPLGQRQALIEHFQSETSPPFFILSLRSGGVGLNLTTASNVIHFDRWWNPAVENQATDRAFRIGQKKDVQVHTLIAENSIEEKIDEMLTSKQNLSDTIFNGNNSLDITKLSDKDILEIMSLKNL